VAPDRDDDDVVALLLFACNELRRRIERLEAALNPNRRPEVEEHPPTLH